jgi:hypothetical protein
MRSWATFLTLSLAFGAGLVAIACSSDDDGKGSGGNGDSCSSGGDCKSGVCESSACVGDGTGAGGTGGIVFETGGTGNGTNSGGSGNWGGMVDGVCSSVQPGDGSCVGENYVGEVVPLEIYIMFDQTRSMCASVTWTGDPTAKEANACGDGVACTAGEAGCCDLNIDDPVAVDYKRFIPGPDARMTAVRNAVKQFLVEPDSAGMGVGIGYFGNQCTDATSCTPATYATPSVEIGVLPGNVAALSTSIDAVFPTGSTATGAAIRGACEYTRKRKEQNPGVAVVNLLVTDGKPENPIGCKEGVGVCCPTVADAVQAAEDCAAGEFGVPTYVLGVGPNLTSLNEIAVAGGTKQAYLVEGGAGGDQVLQALNTIRGEASVPCEFQVPPPPEGQELEYDFVNILYTDSTCKPTTALYVEQIAGCASVDDGWYYDNPIDPKSISLCPQTCTNVSTPGTQFLLSVGCRTVIDPPE